MSDNKNSNIQFEKLIWPVVVAVISFYFIQSEKRTDENSVAVPVLVERLNSIDTTMGSLDRRVLDMSSQLQGLQSDRFTSTQASALEKELRRNIMDLDVRLSKMENK